MSSQVKTTNYSVLFPNAVCLYCVLDIRLKKFYRSDGTSTGFVFEIFWPVLALFRLWFVLLWDFLYKIYPTNEKSLVRCVVKNSRLTSSRIISIFVWNIANKGLPTNQKILLLFTIFPYLTRNIQLKITSALCQCWLSWLNAYINAK